LWAKLALSDLPLSVHPPNLTGLESVELVLPFDEETCQVLVSKELWSGGTTSLIKKEGALIGERTSANENWQVPSKAKRDKRGARDEDEQKWAATRNAGERNKVTRERAMWKCLSVGNGDSARFLLWNRH